MERNRRSERAARAFVAHAQTALSQAACDLFDGKPLRAMRTLRVIERLLEIDDAVQQRRNEAAVRHVEHRRRLDELEYENLRLAEREFRLAEDADKIRDFCETMGLNHDALTGRCFGATHATASPTPLKDAPL